MPIANNMVIEDGSGDDRYHIIIRPVISRTIYFTISEFGTPNTVRLTHRVLLYGMLWSNLYTVYTPTSDHSAVRTQTTRLKNL